MKRSNNYMKSLFHKIHNIFGWFWLSNIEIFIYKKSLIPPALETNEYNISTSYQFDYSGVLLHLSNPFNLKTRTPDRLSSR